jgi:rhamnosyltransferase
MNYKDPVEPICDASDIGCVLVLFHPETSVVDTIKRFAISELYVCVVINAADPTLVLQLETINRVRLVKNPCNIGLAAALNQGIACVFEDSNVKFVALFDQDSNPAADLPLKLARELQSIGATDSACIGPYLQDKKAMDLVVSPTLSQFSASDVLSLPTSGTVIPRSVFEKVGPMKTAFFIDAIDHEWCFRAINLRIRCLQSSQISMIHNMGDKAVNWFGQFKPVHHSPVRHYYIIRNHFYLVIHGPAPSNWRIKEAFKLLRRVAVYPFVSRAPIESARLIFWALYDGATERLGECRHLDAKNA